MWWIFLLFFPQFLGLFKRCVKTEGKGQDFFGFLLFFHEQRVGIDHLPVVVSAVISSWDVFNVCLFRGFPATVFLILKENLAPCCAGRLTDVFQRMRMLYNNGLRGCHWLFTALIPKMCVLGRCQMLRKTQANTLALARRRGLNSECTWLFVVFRGFQQT